MEEYPFKKPERDKDDKEKDDDDAPVIIPKIKRPDVLKDKTSEDKDAAPKRILELLGQAKAKEIDSEETGDKEVGEEKSQEGPKLLKDFGEGAETVEYVKNEEDLFEDWPEDGWIEKGGTKDEAEKVRSSPMEQQFSGPEEDDEEADIPASPGSPTSGEAPPKTPLDSGEAPPHWHSDPPESADTAAIHPEHRVESGSESAARHEAAIGDAAYYGEKRGLRRGLLTGLLAGWYLERRHRKRVEKTLNKRLGEQKQALGHLTKASLSKDRDLTSARLSAKEAERQAFLAAREAKLNRPKPVVEPGNLPLGFGIGQDRSQESFRPQANAREVAPDMRPGRVEQARPFGPERKLSIKLEKLKLDDAEEIARQRELAPNRRVERSAWHAIEVDKVTGKAVANPEIAYGEEFTAEQRQERGHLDKVAAKAQGLDSQSAHGKFKRLGRPVIGGYVGGGGSNAAGSASGSDGYAGGNGHPLSSGSSGAPAGLSSRDSNPMRSQIADKSKYFVAGGLLLFIILLLVVLLTR